jgi:tetratricopeptide (TPR) repeat protein
LAARAAFSKRGTAGICEPQKRKRSRRVLTPELEQRIPDTTTERIEFDAASIKAFPRSAWNAFRTWPGFVETSGGPYPKLTDATAMRSTPIRAILNGSLAFHRLLNTTCLYHEDAIAKYQKTIALDPTYALAYSNCGAVLEAQNKYGAAITEYRIATEVGPKFAEA